MSTVVTPYNKDSSKKEQVEEMFDNIAPTYDRLNRIISFNIDRNWRKKALKLVASKKHDDLLDVATGTGDIALGMLKLEPQQITGFDLSANMLAHFKTKLDAKQIENIELIQGDSENMPFETNSFDAVTCAFGVRNFENLEKGLQEMHRVTRPDGQVVILECSQPKSKIIRQLYYFYFLNVLPFIGKLISKDARAYNYLPESAKVFPSGEKFAAILKDIGFKNIKFYPRTFGVCTIYQAIK